MTQNRRPLLESLEDRLVPTASALAWPDARHLTVSFVPDGTAVGSGQSNLFQTMAADGVPVSVWEGQILAGLQAWADKTNINLTVVPDDGAALGTPGLIEGDPRFGDIRIASSPLSNNLVSTSVPYSPQAGTWSGDLILNPQFGFSVGGANDTYDIYSVALHEAGHILAGLPSNNDPTSTMYQYYNGVRTNIDPADVKAIQALYGVRDDSSDFWTQFNVQNFSSAAVRQLRTDLSGYQTYADASPNLTLFSVAGQIDNASDVDWYTYRTTNTSPNFTVNLLTSNESLLEGKLTVYDACGRKVAAEVATDPQNGDLTVEITDARPGETYYFSVSAANHGVFDAGAYRLQVVPDSASALREVNAVINNFAAHPRVNDTQATAIHLHPYADGPEDSPQFGYNGDLQSASGTDWYKFHAPDADGKPQSFTITAFSQVAGGPAPVITVYDAKGDLVQTTIEPSADGTVELLVPASKPHEAYYIAVSAADPTATTPPGHYFVGVQFNAPATPAEPVVETDALGYRQQDFRSVILPEATLLHLDFAFTPPPGVTEQSALGVTLYDSSGDVVYSTTLFGSQTASVNLELPAGSYTFRFVGGLQDGSSFSGLNYTVGATVLNTPLGPSLTDPNGAPPPRQSAPQWTNYGITTVYALTDPYGHPLGKFY